MAVETEKANTIPQHVDIDEKYTWALTDIYSGDDAWDEDFKKAESLIAKAGDFAGKLAQSPQTLYDCLETRSELSRTVSKLYFYAHLNKDLDNRVSRYQEMSDKAANLGSKAGAVYSFVEPELLEIDEKKLLEMSGQFAKTDIYDFYIKELIRSKMHIRSKEVEEVMAMASTVTRGPESTFSMLDDADLTYPSIEDEKGQKVVLTKQRFAKFMESSDRRVRRNANEGFYSSYKNHINTLASTLSTTINRDIFYSRVRRFDNALAAALDGDNIPVKVFKSLIETTENHIEALHKYVRLRRKILKIDDIKPYDMFCPLFPEQDYEVQYDEAVERVLEAVKPLGNKYRTKLEEAFASRWIDVFETQGKGSGAYSWGDYSVHPYVLMNYNDTVDNMFTLAHEMGHAMHSFLANSTQPYPKASYSTFVAEVASTLNEGLLMQLLLVKAKDTKEKLYLLNRYVDNTVGTFFNQVMYAHFELLMHEIIEKGGALSPDILTKLWKELTERYYGPDMDIDEFSSLKWSRIPHFYMDFYVFQYATSYAASQAILDKLLKDDNSIIDNYLKMLSSGGRDYPIELLKICEVDMNEPAPILATIKMFDKQVTEMDKLTG